MSKDLIKMNYLVCEDLMCKIVIHELKRGVGANFIYPIIGIQKYGWVFSGSDVNKESIKWAEEQIIQKNNSLKFHFNSPIRYQENDEQILDGVINIKCDKFDFTICNPPFFDSQEQRNARYSSVCPINQTEDQTSGGEIGFLCRLAHESAKYRNNIKWFTSLIGKKTTFEFMKTYLKEMILDSSDHMDDGIDYDILIATGEIEEGQTKRWLIGWKFINFNEENNS
ncbi:sam-dependent methyltransferase [Stylonychia lemnae]|uniref:Sam-dependent methyltransferase n=1 Tax=Stylonychia lemnae TaxID=5949 RepID=A0A078ALM1_STYLE|nr:sam-dependent methyltransferase [Stylonychia lemnae]|eukprot:CDW82307.1 sam-dependent methyltransferase [Stylonychia lemnae]